MTARLRDAVDRWAVVWWPRAASDAALVARYDALAAALRASRVRGPGWRRELTALADIGPVAREMRRRGLDGHPTGV